MPGPFTDPPFDPHAFQLTHALTSHYAETELQAWQNTAGAGSSVNVGASCSTIDLGQGALRIYQKKEEPLRTLYRPWTGGGEQFFRFPCRISCWMVHHITGTADNNSLFGIGLGFWDQAPPAPQSFPPANPAGHPYVHLRCRLDTKKFELASDPTGGLTTVQLAGVPDAVAQIGQLLTLEWDPSIPILRGYINGVLGGVISDPAALPDPTDSGIVTSHCAVNVFITNGNNAAAHTRATWGPMVVTRPGFQNVL